MSARCSRITVMGQFLRCLRTCVGCGTIVPSALLIGPHINDDNALDLLGQVSNVRF